MTCLRCGAAVTAMMDWLLIKEKNLGTKSFNMDLQEESNNNKRLIFVPVVCTCYRHASWSTSQQLLDGSL